MHKSTVRITFSNMKFFNRTLVFDFGSSKTIVCEDGKVVFDEPTLVTYWPKGVANIGNKALLMRMQINDGTVKPIVNGYVGSYEDFEVYVKAVVKKIVLFPRLCLKTVVIAIPNDMSGDENATACERAFFEPFRKMGIKDIRTIHRGIAALMGASNSNVQN